MVKIPEAMPCVKPLECCGTCEYRFYNSELKDDICHNPKSSGYGIATGVNDYCGFWSWDK